MKIVKDDETQKIVPNTQLKQTLTDEEVEAYQEQMFKKALWKLQLDKKGLIVNVYNPNLHEVRDREAIAHLKLFQALTVNTTSAAWVTGMIELLGEFEGVLKHSESIEVITKRFIYLIDKYKKDNQQVLETLTDNINFVSEQLEKE